MGFWIVGTFLCYRYLMGTNSWDIMSVACPTRQVLDRIADKWTMLVVLALQQQGTLRFSQLRREIEGVSPKMLTQTVRALERDGMLCRTVIPTVPVTVTYELTGLGHRLGVVVSKVREWAYANIEQIEAARFEFDGRSLDNSSTMASPAP